MNNEFMSPLIADYLNPDDLVDLHQPQSSSDPFAQSPMSPVPSTASTPPTSAPSTAAALATTASGYPGSVIPAPYHSMNPTTSAITGTSSSASSFTGPVSLSTAPHYGGGGMPFPRRAEFSYAQNIHNHPYGYSPTPTMMGQPQLPRPRTLQMPVAPLLQTQQQQQQMLQQQQMMTPTSATTTTMVPEIPSSAPDGPPTGGGGARKRPKYTRSKKGCLTCRSKKIKCDERHPMCTRCEHGHRECTWPEAVLPRRPKGAMRGIGGEGDEEIGLVDEEGRRQSIPGSAVSTHFPPPSSTTSSHFPGISNNSPFEPAPRRDAFESDGFPAGSQFSVPALPANNRPFYPRQMGAAALPSGEFYPVTAVNGQPIEEYEFPPRQTFGTGASSSAAVAAAGRPTYPNGTLYPGAGAPSSSGYAADLRRASWDSSAAATDARRPSWDASGAHASSVSSPASSVVGLGLTGGSGGPRSVGSSAGNTTAGSSISGGMGGSGIPPGGLMLLHSPDPLSPFFRSVQERNLIKHYCHSSANIIMALPPTPNPILAVTLPIVLDKPPGTHAPTEALRLALLGVGAVHMAYLTSRRRVCVGVGAVGPGDNGMVPVVSPMGVSSDLVGGEADAARMMGLSSMLRLGATRCLAVACRNPEETRSDAALGATMAITLIDIFSGGHQWTRNINLAKTLIALRGGPSAILNSSVPKQARFGGGVTVSPARFWLEMLAVYETFGSLTSGEEPTLLAPGNTDWWFDDGNHSYHANSIEKVFGMARSMITLIAKVSAFLCRTIRERAVITEEGATLVQLPEDDGPAPMPDLDMPLGTEDAGPDTMIPDFDFEKFLNDFGATPGSLTEGFITGPTSEMSGPPAAALTPRFDDVTPAAMAAATTIPMLGLATDFNLTEALGATQENPNRPVLDEVRLASLRGFYEDAKVLYAEVESWEDNVTHDQREARVLVGNKTHKLALQIIMLRDVFHVPRMDPRVQAFAASILDLCLESSQQNMGVDLTWPVIIAGCQVVTANARIQVAQAFDSFRKQCCFEIESSERIVAEVWKRVDNNEPRDDWRAVVEDEGLRILVL